MGQLGSKDHRIYVQLLKSMLKTRGCSMRTQQVQQYLDFIQGTCPWFPEEGTINSQTSEDQRLPGREGNELIATL